MRGRWVSLARCLAGVCWCVVCFGCAGGGGGGCVYDLFGERGGVCVVSWRGWRVLKKNVGDVTGRGLRGGDVGWVVC